MTPTVSVILPTFERAPLVVGVIKDVLRQPLKSVEVLVMDDGSSDDTCAQVGAIDDARIIYWNLGKLGVPSVLNEGITRSSAPYIMFLHDHDMIEPDLLTALAEALDRNPSAAFAFCGYVFFDSQMKHEQERWLFDLPELSDGNRFLQSMLMPSINSPVLALSMVRRSALANELLNEKVGGCADVELWHRLASTGDVAYVRRPLIKIRGRDQSSQFARPSSTLELMANIVRVKESYISRVPINQQARLRLGWRRQISRGGIYIAWKALEAEDRKTLVAAKRYVQIHGSTLGRIALKTLATLPPPIARTMLRIGRRAVRLAKRSTT